MRTLFGYVVPNLCGITNINKGTTTYFLQGYDFLAGFDNPKMLNFSVHILRDGTRYR